jgi:hypothetical protein
MDHQVEKKKNQKKKHLQKRKIQMVYQNLNQKTFLGHLMMVSPEIIYRF